MTNVPLSSCSTPPQAVPVARALRNRQAKDGARRPVHGSKLLGAIPATLFVIALLCATPHLSAQSNTPTTRVGLPITFTDLYIPGGEAKPKPRPNHEPPIVVRLIAVKPAADGKRYDLEVYGLEAGTYNLADFLVPVDPATPPRFDKPIPIKITTGLPPGLTRPAELEVIPPPRIGGYRVIAWTLGVFWFLGLLALIFLRKKAATASNAAAPPPTFAERLHALVTLAAKGKLDADQQASLERLVLGHWHKRLPELKDLPPAEALAKLRHHDKAGPLLRQLEQWLHARNPEINEEQIVELLKPYRNN